MKISISGRFKVAIAVFFIASVAATSLHHFIVFSSPTSVASNVSHHGTADREAPESEGSALHALGPIVQKNPLSSLTSACAVPPCRFAALNAVARTSYIARATDVGPPPDLPLERKTLFLI